MNRTRPSQNEHTETTSEPSLHFLDQNFRGYLGAVGKLPAFKAVTVAVQPTQGNSSSLHVFVYEVDDTGATLGRLLSHNTVRHKGTPGKLEFVTVPLDEIASTKTLAIGYHADAPIAFYGRRRDGTYNTLFYANNASKPENPTWRETGQGSVPASLWARVHPVTGTRPSESRETVNAGRGAAKATRAVSARETNLKQTIEPKTAPHQSAVLGSGLKNLRAALSGLESGRSNASVSPSLAVIGDSWTAGLSTGIGYWDALAEKLYAKYGFGGHGWLTLADKGAAGSQPNPARAKVTRGGTINYGDEANAKGLHLGHVTLSPSAFVQVVTQASAFYIHYVTEPSGGEFRYQVDDGEWTTVNTNAPETLKIISLTDLSDAEHTLRIEGVSGAATICGVDARRPPGSGIVFHSLGNGGSNTKDWAQASSRSIWKDAFAALAPQTTFIFHGTNDQAAGHGEAELTQNYDTIISNILAAHPATDIGLISSGDNERSNNPAYRSSKYTMAQYDAFTRAYAEGHNYLFFSGLEHLGSFAEAKARGLMETTTQPAVHLNAAGGKVLAQALYDSLEQVI
jgi:lysophospholipase L1-like esterase